MFANNTYLRFFSTYPYWWVRPTYVIGRVPCYILMYYLIITLFSIDEVCLVCRKACLNTLESTQFIVENVQDSNTWHEFVRDVLFYIFRWAKVSTKKNAFVNFLTDPHERRLTFRPPNVLLNGYVGENMHV